MCARTGLIPNLGAHVQKELGRSISGTNAQVLAFLVTEIWVC